MVSLVLLTLSVALGIAELVRFASPRWPRFVVAALHRNVALVATAFLGVHIATAVADSFAPIRVIDVFVPFIGSYRPLWLGLGTVACDLMIALVVTSLLRERLGYRAWRAVHWAAYAMWPAALLHGLGTGSDTKVRWAVAVNVACLAAVLAAVLIRVGWTRTVSSGQRAVAALGAVAVAAGVTAWMVTEPMRPGWARKAGTPTALLAASQPVGAAIPIPFTSATQGSIRRTTSDANGSETVTIDATLPAIASSRLRVAIEGTPLDGGGVSMQKGSVRLGVAGAPALYQGAVVSLDGTRVRATVHDAGGAALLLSMDFSIQPGTSRVGGTVTGRQQTGVG